MRLLQTFYLLALVIYNLQISYIADFSLASYLRSVEFLPASKKWGFLLGYHSVHPNNNYCTVLPN